MYLRRVELTGFKSFADKTEFEFVPGITAVVGPNGSGKSNITDSIRWVLGEQSAKSLRGSKMEDVIFAGSDSRKPVNYSEVSLTLDNEDHALDIDFSEVTVTRRLYRSGDSEFLINKQPCRLKDITELFMDTGLGKEAYSIIGQGKIDEILSSKAEDRRGVFEEAAGIVKYKARKKEAEKKLDETEQNLLRIKDLIFELEGQLEPLEGQAKKAKQYKEYAEKLKELNVQIYVHDIEKTYQEWQEVDKLQKELANQQVEMSAEVNQKDAAIEQKRWSVNQLEKELDVLHQQLIAMSEKVEQAEGKKEVLKEREKNQESLKTQALQTIEKLTEKKGEIQAQLDIESDKLDAIEEKISQLTKQLQKEESFLEQVLTDHQAQIEKYKEEYFECLNEMAANRNETRHLANARESLTYRIDKLKAEAEEIEREKEENLQKKQQIEQGLKALQKEIEQLNNHYQEQLLAQKDLKNQYDFLQQEIREEQQKLNSLISRHEILKEMQEDFSGYHHGVKAVLKWREANKLHGIHGAVAELIQVPKQYETAIEIALGGSLQHIVVEQESIARKAIAYLKEKKIGRATFLPLDVIKPKELSQREWTKIKTIKGFVGVASQLIQFDDAYASIVEYLLGHIIVTTNLEAANKIARELGYTKRMVTLDGDVVNPGGSMTGGSVQKKQANLLGRQREIEELSKQIDSVKNTLKTKQKSMESIAERLDVIQSSIEQMREDGEQHRLKEQELHGKYQQITYDHRKTDDRFTFLQQEIKQLQDEFDQLANKEKHLAEQLEVKSNKEKELKQKIEQAEQIRKQDESTKQKANQTITNLKIDLAKYNQERDGSKTLVERLFAERNEILANMEQQQQILLKLERDLSVQKEDQSQISQDIEQLRMGKDQLQKVIEEKRLTRSKNVQEIESEDLRIKEKRKELKIIESELHKVEVKLNRLDVELENLLYQLREEYEMSYEWAKQFVERTQDIEYAKKEVRQLKQSIHALGEVNLGAIEEFERVSERYDFLTKQKQDLVEAKQTLYQVIEEVDEEMTRRFKESFDAIRKQFQEVFTRLFGGGRADLILSDPDHLLETGIEIVAQPPGKKLQNLALLSGGEKALTAITLLFSILKVKPVPFCVLDEVEAALDEANVVRFSEYLKEFSRQTQFIVVTHRKGTMEGADVLYGVTMQESGVSRLVSVKLEEKEKAMQMVE